MTVFKNALAAADSIVGLQREEQQQLRQLQVYGLQVFN